jgi:hypothetical protein
MKLVFTALVVIGLLYGVYQAAIAGNGWFQMSGAVDQVAEKELPALIERAKQQAGLPSAGLDNERATSIRAQILRAAEEHRVPLRQDDVAVGVVDNSLEIRLAWDAPIVVYAGRPYVELPLSMERRFSLRPRAGY